MPSRLKYRSKTILFKEENTYGVDATPEATEAIRALDVSVTPIEADTVDSGEETAALGSRKQVYANLRSQITFSVYLAGSGSAGTKPKWDALIRSCGFKVEQNTDDDNEAYVLYSPNSDSIVSGTLYFFIDKVAHKMVGCRGNVVINFEVANYPRLTFNLIGEYQTPVQEAPPIANFDSWQDTDYGSSQNTPQFTLFDYAPYMRSLTLDAGVVITSEDLVNGKTNQITDRQGTGSVTIDAPAVNDINYIEKASQGSTGTLEFTHGTASGNIIQIICPNVQISPPSYGDQNGVATLSTNLNLLPNMRDDEIAIWVK